MRNLVRVTLVALLAATLTAPLAAQDIRRISDGPSRKGFWLGLGVAGGQYDNECDLCNNADPASGFGGHVRLGATLSPKFRLGADLFGISTSNGQFTDLGGGPGDITETTGDLTLSGWFYPSAQGNFWLQLGLGGVVYQADVKGDQKYTAMSGGGVLGLGYDFRVGRNGSLTPYVRWAGSSGGKLKDENGDGVGPEQWKTKYIAVGVDYVFH